MEKQISLFSTDHITTAKDNHVKKLGLMYVPATMLKVLDGFNDRTDYGSNEDMNELAESLFTVGPKVPLKGYKSGNHYIVIVGHRRLQAAEMVRQKHGKVIVFPFQTYSPGTSKAEMLLDTLLTNSGKDLTPLEKASSVSKLIEEKIPVKEICSALGGVSEVYIKNLQKLWAIPEELKDLIRKGVVSSTLIMGYLKTKSADLEELIEEIKKAASLADKTPPKKKGTKKKSAKVTKKSLSKGKEKNAALEAFNLFRKGKPDEFHNAAKKEAFYFFCQLVDNKADFKKITEFFTGK